jgi:hypothetical protein
LIEGSGWKSDSRSHITVRWDRRGEDRAGQDMNIIYSAAWRQDKAKHDNDS